jgi:uncharacterized membrane protein
MSYRKYLLIRVIGIVVIATLGAIAGTTGNLLVLLPPAIIIGALIFLFSRRVREIVVDERINTVAYKASRFAYLVFVILAVITGAALIYLGKDDSPELFRVGLTLDLSVCALLVFYWLAYIYYNRKLGGKE